MISSSFQESAIPGHAAWVASAQCNAELMLSARRFVELNAQTAETSFAEHYAIAETTLGSRSFAEIVDLHSRYFPTLITKTFAYLRHADEIVVQAQVGVLGAMRQYFETMTSLPSGSARLETVDATPDRSQADSLLTSPGRDLSHQVQARIVDAAGQIIPSPHESDSAIDDSPNANNKH
ncbi:phasin family protein (plasmid) [Paraburkholderia sp. D15]|uniref:phasin family protein n=1 Tax=Paraburkholderia sp. D15 TaxID=2880218 RepID=UPI002478B90D|nr:phasin family protein [Paraburkholderia sp. D15]WGS54997.1 phasin family protein [Paraburkholderia sp. D15]